jgi:hypothetical protein
MTYSAQDRGDREGRDLEPHRGTTVLVLGILGFVVCFICGIIAWSMANTDLRAMQEGRMDPSGRDITNAGKICGIISTLLAIGGLVVLLLFAVGGGVAVWKH